MRPRSSGLERRQLDLKPRGFPRHADPQGKAVMPSAPVDVEPVLPGGEEAVVGPARAGQNRPVEAERNQAELAAVGMAREGEVGRAGGNQREGAGVVQQQ